MKPFVTLAKARTPEGAELTLHARDTHFFLYVNRQPLMGTNASVSEMELARLACARLTAVRAPRVLIGGLGFGFTLRQVLELTGPAARVEVAELLPEVVAWNREFLHEVNGRLLDDPRVRIHTGDVFQLIESSPAGHYDAILLDVDNGPIAMVQHGNARLYQAQGFTAITRALKPGGRVTFWSAAPDTAFAKRLTKAGFKVEVVASKAWPQEKTLDHKPLAGIKA